MPLTFKVTTAGRAALVNAANTGTLPVLVSQIGVTATGFTAAADGSDLALPGELKRLSTFGAAAVADDTIHIVIRDESGDTYSLRGFALYLADGTLFGLYGQADVIVEKSAAAMMLLATDIIFADIDAASLTFGNTNFLNPPATVDTQGVVELATDAETIPGTDAVRAVTPKGLMAKLVDLLGAGAPSAYVKTLLTAVDRVAFRTLLSIKTAASYDIGVGNGLDADLLDGQHGAYYRQWDNLQGVPSTFAPSAHQHSAGDITSGLLPVARGGTGVGSITAGNYIIGAGTGPFGSKAPAQVLTDIGAAPVVHSHAISAVNGLQDALDSRPLQSAVTSQISAAVGPKANRVGGNEFTGSQAINGGVTINCVSGSDTLQVNTPGNSPSGSYVAISSPNASPGIIANYGGDKRRDILFTSTGIQFGVSSSGVAPGVQFTFSEAGAFSASGGFDYGSSARLKNEAPLMPMPYGLAEIEKIETYRGRYNEDYCSDGRDRLFVIIEQVGKLIPEVEKKSAIDYRGEKVSAAQFEQLWPVAIKAMQELSARTRDLQRQVDAMKAGR